jgi:hypothetical protein
MKLGLFLMPSHPPERGLLAGQQWGFAVLREADRLGYSEAWIGEHFTSRWEPNPAPDLLIAQALNQTSAKSSSRPAPIFCPIIIRPNSPAASPTWTILGRPLHARHRRERPAERLAVVLC